MPEQEKLDVAKRLAAIVESSDDAIVGKDLTGIVTSWNQAAERMFGYSASEMIGQSIRRIIPQERQAEEDHVLAQLTRGERVDHFETIRQRKDGSLLPVSLTVSPVRNDAGIVIGASKIARDISERRRAEEEQARLLKIAQDASRLRDEFLATLSHELRTPLNAILGYTRMLKSGMMGADKQRRAVETVERNASSLARIIEDVLDVSRIISGKIRLHLQPIVVADVIGAALESVRPAAELKGVRIETRLELGDAPVIADPDRLQQVIWNLASNAIKFTPRDGRVQVRLERADSHVEITVTDTGVGIDPAFVPHVFERFRQADSSMTRERGGLGLGLAITRHLVELHGGTVQVTSPGVGRGATFRVRLPMVAEYQPSRSTAPADLVAASLPSVGAANTTDLHGVSVLAVDDDPDALGMLRDILEASGARVITADSAMRAMRALDDDEPDVIVADLGMPQMSGFDLIEEIRRSDDADVRAIPAAALTAYARSEDRARALRSGFQMHLAKPIDPEELTAAIASLSKRHAR